MGRKIPYDTALKIASSCLPSEDDPIFIPEEKRRYGYRINVNHPRIRPLFAAYHRKIGVPENIHLSGAQRHHFEMAVIKLLERKGYTDVQPSDPDGQTDPRP